MKLRKTYFRAEDIQRLPARTGVILEASGDFICLRTINVMRKRQKSHIFYIKRAELEEWYVDISNKTHGFFDGSDIIKAQKDVQNNIAIFTCTWKHSNVGEFQGFGEELRIPIRYVSEILHEGGQRVVFFSAIKEKGPRFVTTQASNTIRSIREHGSKLDKSAFRKAMKTQLQYQNNTIYLHPDFVKYSFGFSTEGSWPISGGLIRSEGAYKTHDGKTHPKVTYSAHT